MLQLETVEPRTFAILEQLMELPCLKEFHLVGGTALSLMYGHRISEDLDLFCVPKFDNAHIIESLQNKFLDQVSIRTASHFGIFGFIGDTKVDIVRFPHPLIRPTLLVDGIRMYAPEEIIAMKVQAILYGGKKIDYYDIAVLLEYFTIDEFIAYHKEKYKAQNLCITVPKAISFFDIADDSEDPISLKGQTWESVKASIQQKVREYLV